MGVPPVIHELGGPREDEIMKQGRDSTQWEWSRLVCCILFTLLPSPSAWCPRNMILGVCRRVRFIPSGITVGLSAGAVVAPSSADLEFCNSPGRFCCTESATVTPFLVCCSFPDTTICGTFNRSPKRSSQNKNTSSYYGSIILKVILSCGKQ